MIIECPSCEKKFEINESLIPKEGRNLQCGSCNKKWFHVPEIKDIQKDVSVEKYNNDIIDTNEKKEKKIEKKIIKKDNNILNPKKYTEINEEVETKPISKNDKTININKTNYVKLLLVVLISFGALILVLDTFKDALTPLFPNIKFLLNNLYETLKDLFLFFNDLLS
ncbi:MAG: hypothetical protein CBC78_002660 [Candidatus Pelagibacter sp. TMED118]|nr:MAG: hypothetical protein CBC78_002660 [Candidatus Pelagibacter sp. TMED118]|tara:strand:- start:649 stop:1149 length:501 start_codon:yes stop_codon:yes gene_type:complete